MAVAAFADAPLPDSAGVRAAFASPPVEYSTGPLWVWNDLLDERQIRETLRDLASQQVRQAYVHPRPGLMTPYLSEDWFRLWAVAIDEAKRLGMKLWIYDENSYPSGFAGGIVPEEMPGSRGLGLSVTEVNGTPKWQENSVALHRIDGATLVNVTERARSGETLPPARYVASSTLEAGRSPWHAGRFYVNLLTPGVTQKFLDVTLGAYRTRLGAEFGRTIPGVFTDEPHVRPAAGFPWCADLPARFRARWGYDLVDALPSLAFDVGDWRRVRHNYFQLVNELFVERWAKPYYDYCTEANLASTGHYWEHEWPNCRSVPDNMTMYAWQHQPGIDILMNQYAEDANAQFGNARSVRELASIAHQLGRTRTLCETYGAGGWDLRLQDMKRIGDWLQVLGVNVIDEHLSYVTIRGGRKRDHPQSFSYHEPWWPAYHVSASYQSRLSAALSQGEVRNDVLLLEPTSTAWMYNLGRHSATPLAALGKAFQDTVNAWEAAQIGYDIGSEYVLAHHGAVRDGRFVVGRCAYRVVVLPAFTENLNQSTLALLEQFLRAGGTVVALAEPPARVEGAADERPAALARATTWKNMPPDAALEWLRRRESDAFAVERAAGDRGILFHQRRHLADGELVFLVNTSLEHASAGVLKSAGRGVERWDVETGRAAPYSFQHDRGRISAAFTLPPSGSLLLFVSNAPRPGAPAAREPVQLPPAGPPEIARLEPNVLTLDFVDVTAGGKSQRDAYCYNAAQFVFRQNGEPRNPWESAVQFRDEILSRQFPPNSGFEATYRFTIADRVPSNLAIVVERPDLYTITCNDQPVKPTPGAWWLDKAFGSIALGGVARVGENTVTIKAAPLTHFHELEPAYLRGDFRVRPTDRGFEIVADQPLALGPWNEQGHAFYAAGVRYRQKFNVPATGGAFAVAVPSWYGSAAHIVVNGADAGWVAWPPWRCDVTSHLRPGENTIDVIVIGTLKNTLGPHHGNPPLGRAWPASFRAAPKEGRARGQDYSTVGYGLFAPFTLDQTALGSSAASAGQTAP